MWVRRAAIRPVPSYALVPTRVLEQIEEQLAEDDDDSRQQLDDAFTRFERTQPALAERISAVLSRPLDETALALGYFLTLAIWLAFDETFDKDLQEVNETGLTSVEEALALDEQIRLADPAEAVDSDDVIAMEQPDVLAFVQEHLDAALEANANDVNVDDVHEIYRVVLIEVLALSYAVRPPSNWAALPSEFTA
ncbi:hypothetical protein [Chondromyces crocatus]|uniref:Uncharacterized protein n=1 Tax=Chondromyces crocatus TaxID=52 RepID=A0A0K1ERV6_CHOCO|nr:hypothetical protein [Chondromyces crocatus]AKT43539.1 uncharacterized protein CMC5_077710 [Chondromyces crocatus]